MNGPLEGIVVGALDLGEADRLVRLLSASEGRLSVVARGARGSRRRFSGATDLGTKVALTRTRRRGELSAAAALDVLRAPLRARDELERIAYLAYGCELCAAFAPEGAPAEKLYGLLDTWLALTESESGPTVASRCALEAKALTFAGTGPTLLVCAVCGAALSDPAVFDPDAGGGRHAHCGGGESARPVAFRTLKILELLRRTPLADTPAVPVPADGVWLLADFARYQLGRELAARAWWAAVG